MTTRTGGCLCRAVRYECAGEPQFALQCHCRDCQLQSGAPHVAAVRMPSADFRIVHGAPLALRRQGRFRQRGHACLLRRVRHAALRAGVDPARHRRRPGLHVRRYASWFLLEANIFVKSAQPWDRLDPAVPAFPTYPTGKSYSCPAGSLLLSWPPSAGCLPPFLPMRSSPCSSGFFGVGFFGLLILFICTQVELDLEAGARLFAARGQARQNMSRAEPAAGRHAPSSGINALLARNEADGILAEVGREPSVGLLRQHPQRPCVDAAAALLQDLECVVRLARVGRPQVRDDGVGRRTPLRERDLDRALGALDRRIRARRARPLVALRAARALRPAASLSASAGHAKERS